MKQPLCTNYDVDKTGFKSTKCKFRAIVFIPFYKVCEFGDWQQLTYVLTAEAHRHEYQFTEYER